MLHSRHLRERELESLRQRISRDLHDEIGSHPGSIRLMSELALRDGHDSDSLEEIHRLAQEESESMRGMSGLDGICFIKERAPSQSLIVILTVFEDDDKVFKSICAGASGYLLKTGSVTEITQAVHDALAGGSLMTPRIARRVLDMFSKLAPKHSDYGLSDREKEILQLMTAGLIKRRSPTDSPSAFKLSIPICAAFTRSWR